MHTPSGHQVQSSSRTFAWFGLVAFLSVFATLLVSTGTASAASFCRLESDGGVDTALVFVDEPSRSLTTYIGMEEGELFVNGESCGSPDEITVIDSGRVIEDNILIDLASPMRANNDEAQIFLILDSPNRDKVTVLGRNTEDHAILGPQNFVVARPTDYANSVEEDDARVRLAMNWDDRSSFELRVNLLGDDDTFRMVPVAGNHFAGKVTVDGGDGADQLFGGPGKQKFLGGRGADIIEGADGNDDLRGGGGNDDISGGPGRDKINGGKGRDTMNGDSGNDIFIARDRKRDTIDGGDGSDRCKRCDAIDQRTSVES